MLQRIVDRDKDEYILFTSMYTSYCNELMQYGGPTDPVTGSEIKGIFRNKELMCYWIIEEGARIGFVLVGHKENKHPLADFFIGEFYIRPDYRRLNYGKTAIRDLVMKHPGKYCLYILDNNNPAKTFWQDTFTSLGYRDDSKFYTASCPPNSSFYFFTSII